MDDHVSFYTRECNLQGLEKLWPDLKNAFSNEKSFVTAEYFDENIMAKVRGLKEKPMEDLISARFFDGSRQIKIRRLKDSFLWLVADFEFDGFREYKTLEKLSSLPRSLILWGTFNKDIESVFNEIIRIFENETSKDYIHIKNFIENYQ